jgi:hypothetical protein
MVSRIAGRRNTYSGGEAIPVNPPYGQAWPRRRGLVLVWRSSARCRCRRGGSGQRQIDIVDIKNRRRAWRVPPRRNQGRKLIAVLEVGPGIGERGIATRDLAVVQHDNAGSLSQPGSVPSGITAVSKHASPGSVVRAADAVASKGCRMVYPLAGFDSISNFPRAGPSPPCASRCCA